MISHQYSKDIDDKFLEVIDDYLEQLVTFPTRASNTLVGKWTITSKKMQISTTFWRP